ncbi:hypothetical protein MHAS_02058 [Mycolicibacterium hassiacum DSM 44199]|uniref:hypothetical protein n=1 Tax=Mycolicibacterium hassiacum TaxID=46351 RepID=UPI0002ED8986|nr:hypothetical protein [Mycolicibacterium hassiacum]MDA4085907.1 membrane protein [Mycolicibacterium hassiacum DSM 44199]VCT90353.1 hypothetical protein MHAS_02058 [Mycolicibacterium hassiacum DSM 44199]
MSTQPRRLIWLSILSLVVADVALGVAGWALWRTQDREPVYSETQIADAKAGTCSALDVVRRGVSLNTNLQPAGGPEDVTGAQAVAANARVSLYDGGQYLLARLDPATPPELADKVREFADTLMDIGAYATAGVSNQDAEQAERLRTADEANKTLIELCK